MKTIETLREKASLESDTTVVQTGATPLSRYQTV